MVKTDVYEMSGFSRAILTSMRLPVDTERTHLA
jgi:hypothetical protein